MLAYRAYLSEHTKHRSLEFLYGVARSLTRAPDIETRARRPARPHARGVQRRLGRHHPVRRVQRPAAADVAARRGRVPDDAAGRARAGRRAADRRARRARDDRAPQRRPTPAIAAFMDEEGTEQLAVAPVPGETRLVGVMLLGDRRGADRRVRARRPAALRDARRPRRHVAGVRPARAGDPPDAGAAGRAGAPGVPRSADRPRQPRAVHAPRARVAVAAGRARRRCSSSISTTSSGSTTTPGTPRATAVLIAAAERIRRCVRPTDLAARLGGDEFAVLLEDADERRGEEIAHRIVALLSEAVTISGRPVLGAGLDRHRLHARRLGDGRRRPHAPRRHRHVPGEGGRQGAGARVHAGDAPELADQGAVARRAAGRARRRPVRRPLPADRGRRDGRGRGRRGAGAVEPPAPRPALALRLRARRGADGDHPGDRPGHARAGVPGGGGVDAGGRLREGRGRAREPLRRGAADDRARGRRRRRARADGAGAAPAGARAHGERAHRRDADGPACR